MEYLLYFSRFLYRIRWWLIAGTTMVTLLVYFLTANLSKTYDVKATLYTGVVSGYSIDDNSGKSDYATAQNAIDNLINIIKAESTLQRVSLRLYVRGLIHGNPNEDNDYISAANYRQIYNHLKSSPHAKEIMALIDKNSEDQTVENFFHYQRPNKENYIYGLFYYTHPHYSYGALQSIQVSRIGASDLLEIKYSADDPRVAYHTINILMDEFVQQYRNIRYGETDKVIEYFKSELNRIGGNLRTEEDSLTRYNVEKRVINYYDETKEIASINKEFELKEQDAQIAFNSSKVMLDELNKQMDTNAKQLITNVQFVNKLKEASTLTGKISEMETVPTEKSSGKSTQSYRNQLAQSKQELSDISEKYMANKYTKEGASRENIISEWLAQTLAYEKAKSDLLIIKKSRRDLDDRYKFFAPVGSTIKRKERSIDFVERNYMSLLGSYNAALMRKKSLEMTSATIKVLNPPAYPITAEPTGRKNIVMMACGATFIFILGFFLLLELLDQTLRDSIRAHRLTGLPILGAFPSNALMRYRQYNKACADVATKQLSSSILRFFTKREKDHPYIVNFISTEAGDGKSYLSEQLTAYWSNVGLKVRKLTWGEDFDINSRSYLLAKHTADFYTPNHEDILIIEYPPLNDMGIPEELLQEAQLNLLIARTNRGWKETDKLLVDRLKEQLAPAPLYLYLNRASRDVVQDYTGMLPPYTFIRQQLYRLSQLALTENVTQLVSQKDKDSDDEE